MSSLLKITQTVFSQGLVGIGKLEEFWLPPCNQWEVEMLGEHFAMGDSCLLSRAREYLGVRRLAAEVVRESFMQRGLVLPGFKILRSTALTNHGQPEMIGNHGQQVGHVSLAHSEDIVAAAFHPARAVGVDIEYIKPQAARLAERISSPQELVLTDNLPSAQIDLALTAVWTIKEATMKAHGAGFTLPMHNISIQPIAWSAWLKSADGLVLSGQALAEGRAASEFQLWRTPQDRALLCCVATL